MKKYRLILMALAALVSINLSTSCSKDDNKEDVPPTPEEVTKHQYELYVCPVKHGGMSMNKNGTFVRKVNALTAAYG